MANISADIINETVTGIELERETDHKDNTFWWLVLFISLLVASYLIYHYSFRKGESVVEEIKEEIPFDYYEEAIKLLEMAESLFNRKKYKDAYGKASEALRLYYSHKLGIKEEITTTETIRLLKKNKVPYENTQKCLSLCSLVEFAKYKPNKKDFDEILSLAKKEIKKEKD
jgi:HEPN domain-containing protein